MRLPHASSRGLDRLPKEEQRDTRALSWSKLLRELARDEGCRATAGEIYTKAIELANAIPDLAEYAIDIKQEEILVDLPFNKVVVRGGDILTRTDGGHIGTPNLFFDPERWSQAYEHQKQCGFVFTPRNRVALVALASRIVFFETFGLVMDEQAERAAKVTGIVHDAWVMTARDKGLCSPECAEVLQGAPPVERSRARTPRRHDRHCTTPGALFRDDAGVLDQSSDPLRSRRRRTHRARQNRTGG